LCKEETTKENFEIVGREVMFQVQVDKVFVFTREGYNDTVVFFTQYSNPMVYAMGMREQGGMNMQFETTPGYGAEYVRTTFGVEPEIRKLPN
jgi:hypothetical protein